MRWFAFPLVMLFAVLLMRCDERVSAGAKKEPGTTEKKEKQSFLLVVPPAGGKEVKLIDWRFTQGTRRITLLDGLAGAECLEFREDKSTSLKNGIRTLLPLTSIRKIDFDRDKKTVSAIVLNVEGADVVLTGGTKFASNKITIEGEAVLDGLGQATVKFQGGVDKGLFSVAFPPPKRADKIKGSPAVVIADDKEKTKHIVYDPQPLYLVDGQYRVLPYLMFKKTVKIDMDKLAGLRYLPPEDKKKASNSYEVTLRDGAKHNLSLLLSIEGEKKKAIPLVGLVGRVPVGFKVFHLDSILEFRVDDKGK